MSDVWLDDFDGPAGAPPDPSVWQAEVGGGGWGDDQLQCYTASPANACHTGDGHLALVARREAHGGITSARLRTLGRLEVKYGSVEARIRVPAGAGLWPAFWMLGANIDQVGWPACGEIDVMEHVGSEPRAVHGTAHGTGYSGVGRGVSRTLRAQADLAENFHIYGVDWSADSIAWHLDGTEYFRLTPTDAPGPWPFRQPFYLLLNLAVGGAWPRNALDANALPATMLIDWVRVS
jgi:beta-glucanase (GH16 family)